MSEKKELALWQKAIANSERKFEEIVEQTGNTVAYKSESMFAWQAIMGNNYLMKIANENPGSLRDAVINIASIGISLNPALQFAYLVPREGKACLDISYKGLIKLATDSGSMQWVRADLVYENDQFTYNGPALLPDHKADVFRLRGDFLGCYCVAKTLEGDMLVEVMNSEEIYQARDQSQAWMKKKKGPWKDWFGEMAKKTIIKRASKTWPRSDKNDRMAVAASVMHSDSIYQFAPKKGDKINAWLDWLESFCDDPELTKEKLEKELHMQKSYIDMFSDEDRARFDNQLSELFEFIEKKVENNG